MNSLICCFFSNFLRVLRKVLVIPRLQRSKLWLTGTFSRASVWMAASVQCKDAAIQTEARENVPIRGNMVCFIVTIIVMVFFCLFPPTRLRHRYRASDRPALFFPLVSEYVKDTYMVLRCCTIVHTIYARPTPKRVCTVLLRNGQVRTSMPSTLRTTVAKGLDATVDAMFA